MRKHAYRALLRHQACSMVGTRESNLVGLTIKIQLETVSNGFITFHVQSRILP